MDIQRWKNISLKVLIGATLLYIVLYFLLDEDRKDYMAHKFSQSRTVWKLNHTPGHLFGSEGLDIHRAMKSRPTLRSYSERERPNPRKLIRDTTMNVDDKAIEEELAKEKQRRINLGDNDILKIPEVTKEMKLAGENIPNIVHYIWFNCRKYRVHHFISMKSSLTIQRAAIILFHTNCKPSGRYWEELLQMADGKLRIVKRTPPTQVWGRKVAIIEHKADVARLQVVLEVGGIYLDDDTVILKSLKPLQNSSMVLGESNYNSLANGVILANRNAWFLRRWYQEYQSFDDRRWGESSVLLPMAMWLLFPQTINVIRHKMIRPNYLELKYIYKGLYDWTENYTIHLYARHMLRVDGTAERSLRELSVLNSTFGEIARYVLWGGKQPQNVYDFI